MRKTRNKIWKSFSLVVLVLVVLMGISNVALAAPSIPQAMNEFYVNDFAQIFSEEEKIQMVDSAITLAEDYDGIQVVVSTVKTLDGYTVEEYANAMYNKYGIGKDDMGVLMLVATEDRQIRLEVGRAMEAYITDAKAGTLLDDYAIPYLKENKFSEGMISLQKAVINYITAEINAEATLESANVVETTSIPKTSETIITSTAEENKGSGNFFMNVLFFGVFIVICVVAVKVSTRSYRGKLSELSEKNKSLSDKNVELVGELDEANNQISKLQNVSKEYSNLKVSYNSLKSKNNLTESKLTTLQDRYRRACELHAGLDDEVSNMIREEIERENMAEAAKVDSAIASVIDKPASREILKDLEKAIVLYSRLNMHQKVYVKSDIARLQENYERSYDLNEEYERRLREERERKTAKKAEEEILLIINAIVAITSSDLPKLKRARKIYDELGVGPKKYFEESILIALDDKLRIAKEKAKREEAERRRREEEEERRRKQQREEEERRRRQSMQSSMRSTSSFSSRSSGFGGRSGGGGASRGF